MEALKFRTVHTVSDAPMDNREIVERLSEFFPTLRETSIRLKAFAEEIEINRIQEQGNHKRSEELDHLRTSVNAVRAAVEGAIWSLGVERMKFSRPDKK